ncbi:MAG: tRNA 2-selenouridine(34) synthase MnmH [Betaproteobacteria bacterium]|nr:tRNA 2-selenouridine(34) synthase MnmH [Betaproteobacteria bacterium]
MTASPRDPHPVAAETALAQLDDYDLIIDARSPSEHALDHLPGAVSMPVLDDAERAQVGTLNTQVGAFEAKRMGAALVSRRIAALLDGPLAALPRQSRCLVYCWRGGNRSGSLATVMARVGWPVAVLTGGYREFRRQVIRDLAEWPAQRRFRVVGGPTGSGKSLLLGELARRGAAVLDLEALARHRGSVLGHLPDTAQPSQKRFETLVWDALRRADPARPLFVESESRKIGQCQVPPALIEAIRAASGVLIEASDAVRCELLMGEYRHFLAEPALLVGRLQALVSHHGHERIAAWSALATQGAWPELVSALLREHYDPAYQASLRRNFGRLDSFRPVRLASADAAGLASAAEDILAPD